ncbi:hypothetical protein Taro_010438 [Colocasia esculenta]|uniref:FLZ-type domain-containing protein n=1 Tax=Colocasia esculenta TaxID=4460 RepID=A0A843UCZ2_COLES|nr:hypothetical protein [Colocasia esculenta]
MLGKRTRLAWDSKKPEPITVEARDGHRAAETVMSPLERSPRGWKNRESAGVGLGIVAALEKSGSGGDVAAKAVMGSPRVGAPSPVLGSPARVGGGVTWEGCCGGAGAAGGGAVRGKNTCRGVFCAVDEEEDGCEARWGERGSLCSSAYLHRTAAEDFRVFPAADFLSSCYLCKKKLHGEDIYMYRGEKAFCSMECRYRQIVIDEYQENYAGQVPKLSSDVSISNYSGGRLFYTGVAVA